MLIPGSEQLLYCRSEYIPYGTVLFITPPWGDISKLDCSTTKRVPNTERYVFDKKSSRRYLSNARPFVLALDTINIPTVEIPTTEKSAQGCVTYTRHIRYSTKTHPCQKSPHVLLATKRVEQYGDERRDRCRNVRLRKKCCCGFSDNGTRQLFLRIW